MNFFNIGTAELLLIFVIALIVVGPRRLPEIGRSIGKIMNDLRKMSQELTMQMTQELEALPKELEALPEELEVLPKELDVLLRENEAKEIADQNGSEKE
jgi:Tat protein translocase TatB subunit